MRIAAQNWFGTKSRFARVALLRWFNPHAPLRPLHFHPRFACAGCVRQTRHLVGVVSPSGHPGEPGAAGFNRDGSIPRGLPRGWMPPAVIGAKPLSVIPRCLRRGGFIVEIRESGRGTEFFLPHPRFPHSIKMSFARLASICGSTDLLRLLLWKSGDQEEKRSGISPAFRLSASFPSRDASLDRGRCEAVRDGVGDELG